MIKRKTTDTVHNPKTMSRKETQKIRKVFAEKTNQECTKKLKWTKRKPGFGRKNTTI